MDRSLKIAVILSAVDKMSSIIASSVYKSQEKLRALSSKSYMFGSESATAAAAMAATLYKPVAAYAELEDAALGLKSKLLQDGGFLPQQQFERMTKLAVVLGNKLPGVTADFDKMFASMKSNGADVNTIINGTGKAAAYYAIATKQQYETAGIAATRLQQQMGIANRDMTAAMDIMSRIADTGLEPTEMENFFARSSGALKLFNIQGLQSFKTMGVIGSMLTKQLNSGESAGTGFAKVLNYLANPTKVNGLVQSAKQAGVALDFFDRKGKFLGLENMYAQFSKLGKFNETQMNKILMPLTGGDGADNSIIAGMARAGLEGYNQKTAALAKQAQLADKINIMLSSLSSKWEAGLGNLTNALAAFGGTFAPVLKSFADHIGTASAAMQGFIQKHPTLSKWLGILIIALTAVLAIIGGLGFIVGAVISGWANLALVFSGISTIASSMGMILEGVAYTMIRSVIPAVVSFTTAVWANTVAWLSNPVTWIVIAIVAALALLGYAAYKIYQNWNPITNWFSNQWLIMKAQVSGIISVFRLFGDVLAGVGKTLAGVFTVNPEMIIAGVKQTSAAVSKIANGGISEAYNAAYNKVMKADMAVKLAAAPLSAQNSAFNPFKNSGINNPSLPQPKKYAPPGGSTYVFSPQVNAAPGSDGKAVVDALKPHFEKWIKDHQRDQKMISYK